ncbi:flavin reductase family protein [Thalassorhabdomicrobium marinisediminis]|uniref:flavin reductase family protein n=2 Tax=Thalassorhabdomicrobium marinisediminis TaxID=2170577 RepID=UPI00249054FC|nr:flavin reductase family protein [Thalassorhabdomicrobium marinisediminis]
MKFDFTTEAPEVRYRLLSNFVGPRPIALVSTMGKNGPNAAPMSFFNVFSHDPAILILGIQKRLDGRDKDTVANIQSTGSFVVNMVDMAIAEGMLICGLPFEPGIDEIATAGLTKRPGVHVPVPSIAESPCVMECVTEEVIDYGRRAIILGKVVHMDVRDDCLDPEGRYVDPAAYQPIARLHADNYIVPDAQFELKAPALDTITPVPADTRADAEG